MNNLKDYPKIDNQAATDAERQRYLSLKGFKILEPQHTGRNFYLDGPGPVRLLKAQDTVTARQEACELV